MVGSDREALRTRGRSLVPLLGVALVFGLATGVAVGRATADDAEAAPARPTAASPPASESDGAKSAPVDAAPALDVAAALGPLEAPAPCALALDDVDLIPNASRAYRGGVHEGIDFICGELGHDATTPLPGHVVFVHDSPEPAPEDRQRLLDEAGALTDTPIWTLALLFGRFVVIDHGVRSGAGHVVTVYAHLDEIDAALRPGAAIAAGARIGAIGNSGTGAAGKGETSPDSYHLHWEIHVDGAFLGRGTSPEDTMAIYRRLFGV